MLDALETNQIPERNKVKVLKKHLGRAPRECIEEDATVKSINKAFTILIKVFGDPKETWSWILKDFKRKCTNTRGWNVFGSYERLQLVFRTVNFLRTALCYIEEFLQLSNIIFHSSTLNTVIEVLPELLF